MRPQLLSQAERDRIYERRIRPDLLEGAVISGPPVAMFVAGQPGAGVSAAASILHCDLRRTTGGVVHLSEERLRPYHPHWRHDSGRNPLKASTVQPEIDYWFDRTVRDAQKGRLHLLIEDELLDAQSIHKLGGALRQNDYAVQAVFVNTSREESALSVMAQFDRMRDRGLPARFVSTQEHEIGFAHVKVALGVLEDQRSVDGVRLIDRTAFQIYENRLVEDGSWRKAPRAEASVDVLRNKVRPPKDQVKLAMRWETLTHKLVSDPVLSREVASQAMVWRNEAVARCEATPATAQMLQWAREGAAFRIMDRFEFEKDFPHHARAVASMGAAVIEAEKYDAKERARFMKSARENIAQRIERGDMARIAAREATMREKLQRSQDPPTR